MGRLGKRHGRVRGETYEELLARAAQLERQLADQNVMMGDMLACLQQCVQKENLNADEAAAAGVHCADVAHGDVACGAVCGDVACDAMACGDVAVVTWRCICFPKIAHGHVTWHR